MTEEVNQEVLWGHGFGTLADIKGAMKRLRKFTKDGFFAEVEELGLYDRRRLIEAVNDKQQIGDVEKPWLYLLSPLEKFKEHTLFHIKIYGPGPIKTAMYVKPSSVPQPLDHYVLQQRTPESEPICSRLMTKMDAQRCAKAPDLICTIVQVVQVVDNRIDHLAVQLAKVKHLTAGLSTQPTESELSNLQVALNFLRLMCKQS